MGQLGGNGPLRLIWLRDEYGIFTTESLFLACNSVRYERFRTAKVFLK